jgi:hypothetical protein
MRNAAHTVEGTYSPDSLIAGDHPRRTLGFEFKSGITAARGSLCYLKSGDTQWMVYDGGTVTAGSLFCILVDAIDTTGGASVCEAFICGDFNINQITVTSGTVANLRPALAMQSIYLNSAIAA